MINFKEIDTKRVIKIYQKLNLFPKYNRLHSLKYFSGKVESTPFDHNISYSKINAGGFSIKKYFRTSFLFCIQDLEKSIIIYLNNLTQTNKNNTYLLESNKFLNLYYAYLFISRAILSFHGILLNGERVGTSNKFNIYINNLDCNSMNISQSKFFRKAKKGTKKNQLKEFQEFGVNHSEFWDKYYSLIKNSGKGDSLLLKSSILSFGSIFPYFKEKKYIKNFNASQGRNFYTYRYGTYFDVQIGGINETVKKSASKTLTTLGRDVVELENVVRYNLIYLLSLINIISDEADFDENIMIYFEKLKGLGLANEYRSIYQEIEDITAIISGKI